MLPLENRLIKKEDFERVFQKGRGVLVGPVFLRFIRNNSEKSRFGVSIGLKFSKKATERNSAKRRVREFLRGNLSNVASGFDVVVVLKKVSDSSLELREALKEGLEKAKLITKTKK